MLPSFSEACTDQAMYTSYPLMCNPVVDQLPFLWARKWVVQPQVPS